MVNTITEQSEIVIAKGNTKLLDEWLSLRQRLWLHAVLAHYESEIAALLETPDRSAGYLALVSGTVCGFAKANLRSDYANGCESSPVLFLKAFMSSRLGAALGWHDSSAMRSRLGGSLAVVRNSLPISHPLTWKRNCCMKHLDSKKQNGSCSTGNLSNPVLEVAPSQSFRIASIPSRKTQGSTKQHHRFPQRPDDIPTQEARTQIRLPERSGAAFSRPGNCKSPYLARP